jgi:hypothetical protein
MFFYLENGRHKKKQPASDFALNRGKCYEKFTVGSNVWRAGRGKSTVV